MTDGFRLLHVRRCPHCGVDTPHETTDEGSRCLACSTETHREEGPDART